MNAISLYDLNSQIKQALKHRFADPIWITAEITEVQHNSSGHCYLQLIDKKSVDEGIIATARGTIWAFTYRTLKPYFETTTGQSLAKGIKVLIQVEVVFHKMYGYSLNIKDIDPTFTIGDLERKKREIIEQLQREGIIGMNRELEFPVLPKNIAVISSPTAAGYGDFVHQLRTNPYRYAFHIKLFAAIMQGEKTTESLISALERVYEYETLFDVVVIIRGGGSQTDLGSFDTYDIAVHIAQFPLPVIAGIGHERDETIADKVAYLSVKTPTAAAAFLIEAFHEQDLQLQSWLNNMITGTRTLLLEQKTKQLRYLSNFRQATQNVLKNNDNHLISSSQQVNYRTKWFINNRSVGFERIRERLRNKLSWLFDKQLNGLEQCERALRQKSVEVLTGHKHLLELVETKVRYADPKNVLKRGYSITRMNGKAIRSVTDVKQGDRLETLVADGVIWSQVSNESETEK